MNRRDVLQHLSGVLTLPLAGLSPSRLTLLGRALHDQASTGRGQHRVLNDRQSETVATIAEHIIPQTDTPGARGARVNEFIDLLLAEWCDDAERERFLRGLEDVQARCVRRFATTFVETRHDRQLELLNDLDAEARDDTDHFFAKMKWFTLYGYYTSEIGQKEELQASIVPGRYDPCGPVHRDTPGVW